MEKKSVELNKGKIKLKVSEVPCVGHLLTIDGLKPDPSKTEAIQNMSWPTNVKGVQWLVGIENYLTRFLKNLADICNPLHQLTSLDAKWHWSAAHKNAFKRIKQATTQASVLRYLNPAQETVLQCNTSNTGLGPTLLQNGQPIGICTPESNYTQTEKELLAMCLEQRNVIKKCVYQKGQQTTGGCLQRASYRSS